MPTPATEEGTLLRHWWGRADRTSVRLFDSREGRGNAAANLSDVAFRATESGVHLSPQLGGLTSSVTM